MSKPASDSSLVSIKPRGELRVRKPNGQLLDPAGEPVRWSAYWRRRELEGDIERVKDESEPEQVKDEPAPKGKSIRPVPAPPSNTTAASE